MRRSAAVCLAAALSAAAAHPPSPQPTPGPVSYEALMKAEPTARRGAFGRLSPENKTDIMKTHMRRWLDANRGRLSEEQKAAIAENLGALDPAFYAEPTTREWRDKAIALYQKAEKLFSSDDMLQLFTLDGDFIPETK